MKKILIGLLKYLIGFSLVGAAVGISLLLSPTLKGHYLFLFLAAVSISSLYGGFGVGIATALLAGCLHDYFFQYPFYSLDIGSTNNAVELVLFLSVTLFISWVGARTRAAKRAAEMAVRAREDLIAIVSHDLKNPITAIKITAELMIRKNPADKAAQSIRDVVDRVDILILSILDLEKIHHGHLSLNFNAEDVNNILSDVWRMVEPLAKHKMLDLQVETAPQNTLIKCDKERCLQIFLNLIGNAIKFTPQNGAIYIRIESKGKFIQFTVEDTGIGISADHLPHVFDRYWQAQNTAKQGTGLGLSIVKGIINAHGGRITVKSKPGIGSSFIFTLPKPIN